VSSKQRAGSNSRAVKEGLLGIEKRARDGTLVGRCYGKRREGHHRNATLLFHSRRPTKHAIASFERQQQKEPFITHKRGESGTNRKKKGNERWKRFAIRKQKNEMTCQLKTHYAHTRVKGREK
jgi:hypothetical protein